MFRSTLFGLALAVGAVTLAGCGQSVPPALKPLSAETMAALAQKGMTQEAPIFIRIFKEESELELWKMTQDGQFRLFKTYPICKWSGQLGPKLKEGDLQAPEGFYQVRASQMNPNSEYYLSFNLGFPNAYDRAHDRTGAHLMVHGACKSAGCYAMTDALIEEIYLLAREAFKAGQDVIHVHAFPFRMTEANMRRHRTSPWYGFWRNLKQGYDYFEIARRPPPIAVCERSYLVNVAFLDRDAEVDPRGACPRYRVLPVEVPHSTPPILEVKAPQTDSVATGAVASAAPARPVASTAANGAVVPARPGSGPAAQAAPAPDAMGGESAAAQAAPAAPPQPVEQASSLQAPSFSFSPAAQASIGQGTTFQFAPAYPSASGYAFRLNSTLSR